MTQRGRIYDFLAQVQERPGMFVADHSLEQLKAMLHGYEACLWSHDLDEAVEGRPFHTSAFDDWLLEEKGWSTACGFAHAIEGEAGEPKAALELFFALVEEYRES